jgi:hypothetical protein
MFYTFSQQQIDAAAALGACGEATAGRRMDRAMLKISPAGLTP